MVLLLDIYLVDEVSIIHHHIGDSCFICCHALLSIGVEVLPHHLSLDGVHHESLDIGVGSWVLN